MCAGLENSNKSTSGTTGQMSSPPDNKSDLQEACAVVGFQFEELRFVREGVYRGTLSEGPLDTTSDVFVKLYRPGKRDMLQEFVDVATDAGHPECHLIDNEYPCLVMKSATGRPLSQLLPIAFIPGIWTVRKDRYKQVYVQVGKHLGRLHSQTHDKAGPVLDEDIRKKALQRTRLLDGKITDSRIVEIQELLERSNTYQTPHSLTYGDRSPHNIYFDGTRVTQIDAACHRRSTVYDHASVLVGLRMMHGRLRYPAQSIRKTLETAYWNGYKQTGIQPLPDNKPIAMYCLKLYLSLLEFYDKRVTSPNARLTKWVDPPIIYKEICHTIDKIQL